MGILAAVAAARINSTTFQTRSVYDRLLSQVQYARKVAIAQRRTVCVHISAAQSQLFYADAPGTSCPGTVGVAGPTGEVPFTVQVPSGMTVTVLTLQFDALGRSRSSAGVPLAAPQVVTLTGDVGLQFRIENESGYVHPS